MPRLFSDESNSFSIMASIQTLCFIFLFTILVHLFRSYSSLIFLCGQILWPIVALILAWKISATSFSLFSKLRGPVDPTGKAILITGCDYGFGHDSALRLNKLGFHVFAGCLNAQGEGAIRLKEKSKNADKLQILQLDVTKDIEIDSAFIQVQDSLRETRCSFWGLLNNAGTIAPGKLEFGKFDQQYKPLFEVNVFGVVKVTRKFLPLIREAKGRIVMMSSMCAHVNVPFQGAYLMTKTAMSGFAEALRHELFEFDVKVVTIEPSFARTPMNDRDQNSNLLQNSWDTTAEDVRQAYGTQVVSQAKRMLNIPDSFFMQAEYVYHSTMDAIIDSFLSHEPTIYCLILPYFLRPIFTLKAFAPSDMIFFLHRQVISLLRFISNTISSGNK